MECLDTITMEGDKIALFSDLHLGINQNNSKKLVVANEFIIDFIKKLKSYNITHIFFLGDWYHDRTSINVNTLNQSYDIMKMLCKHFQVIQIIGNHDIHYKTHCKVHSIRTFSDIPNLTIINSTTEVIINNKSFLLCPFHFDDIDKKYDYLFGHFEMSGAALAGAISEGSLSMEELTNYSSRVYSGHYHIQRKYKFKKGVVTTVGNPFQQDWGDYHNDKGFYILDIKTGKDEFIHNTLSPIHVKYFYSSLPKHFNDANGNYVKLLVDTEFEFQDINDLSVKLSEHGALSIQVEFLHSISHNELLEESTAQFKEGYSKYDYIKTFISNMDKVSDIPKNTILKGLTKYFNNVKEELGTTSSSHNDIVFKTITIQNFKSIGSPIVLNYQDYTGAWYIQGINQDSGGSVGTGKTNVASAIVFALYGKDLKNTKNKYIPNRLLDNKKIHTMVELLFSVNGIEYTVTTSLDGNTVNMRLLKGDEDISKGSVKNTKKIIEDELLECSYELFKSSIYLSGRDYSNFFELGKHQKRNFLEDVFNLSIFGKMYDEIRKDHNIVAKEISFIERDMVGLSDGINALKLKNQTFETDQQELIASIKAKLQTKINRKTELEDINLQTSIDKLSGHLTKLELLETQREQILDTITKVSNKISVLTTENKHLTQAITKYNDALNVVCSPCNDTLLDVLSISSNEKELNANLETISKLSTKLDILNTKSDKLRDGISKLYSISSKHQQLIKEQTHNEWVVNHLVEDINTLNKELDIQIKKTLPFDELIQEKTKILQDSKENIAQLYKQTKLYDVLLHIVSEDGVKKYIINDLIKVLNNLIKEYLIKLRAEFTCVFDSSFNVKFLTKSGFCAYDNFSGGEEQSIKISGCLSFRKLLQQDGIRSNITFLDEILDQGVDSNICELMLPIIKEESKGSTTFLISHKEFEMGKFDGVLTIIKQNGITSIEEN